MAKKQDIQIRPLDDRVVVEPIESEDKTAGGIFLPDSAKEKSQKGKIIAAGPGQLLEDGERAGMNVSVGDIVIFGKFSGTDVQVGEKDVKIMSETDLLAILEE
ncbi:MAG: co-chaperone GroES [Planctomycetes bacterium]|nr:co-chaperone GroES [Planctomycetota bacterium]